MSRSDVPGRTPETSTTEFDPYYKWLGIPPEEQPPHHYRLLGVPLFESDPEVIAAAVDQKVAYLRQCALSEHGETSQKLLNEVGRAHVCLLDAEKKRKYDDRLRAAQPPAAAASADALSAPSGNGAPAETAAVDEKLARQKARVTELVADHQYSAATAILEKMAAVKDPQAERFARWAAKQLPVIKARPKKLRAESAAAVRVAQDLLARYEYASAAELLQQVPRQFRSKQAAELIEQANELQEEVDLLIADMDDAVARQQYEGLESNLERLLELKPGHRRARELYRDLRTYGGKGLAVRRGDGPPLVTGGKAAGLPWGVVLGVFVAAFALTSLAVVFYLKSADETIRIEIDDPQATIAIDGETITLTGNSGQTTLTRGQHELIVRRNDTIVHTRNFQVVKGNNPILSIQLLEDSAPASPTPPDTPEATPAADPPDTTVAAGGTQPTETTPPASPDPAATPTTTSPGTDPDAPPGTPRDINTGIALRTVQLTSDGSSIVTVHRDETIRVWDPVTGQQRRQLADDYLGGSLKIIAVSNDNSMIAYPTAPSGGIRIRNFTTGAEIAHITDENKPAPASLLFTPDDKAILGIERGEIYLVDIASGERRWTASINPRQTPDRPAFSADGKLLIMADQNHAVLRDASTGNEIRRFDSGGTFYHFYSLRFPPDGKHLWTATVDRRLKQWDVETGKLINAYPLTGIYTSSGGRLCGDASLVAFVNPQTRVLRRMRTADASFLPDLPSPAPPISPAELVLSLDGSTVIAGNADGRLRLWTAPTDQ